MKRGYEKDEEIKVKNIYDDFKLRQKERKGFEAQWQLNMNFMAGNQFSFVGVASEIAEYDKQYFWQEHEVYNHIAPIIEARLSKLQQVKPKMAIIPASGDEKDIKTARLCKKIINSVAGKLEFGSIISEATKWSEICGTSFYKVTWNSVVGDEFVDGAKGGEVEISSCSPFEIFPDNSACDKFEKLGSVIHAKTYLASEVKNIWGVDLQGTDVNVFSFDSTRRVNEETKKDSVIVIERYTRPNTEHPNGHLEIVAGEKLLYEGELPYINGISGERGFPFIRQVSLEQIGCFWGMSIVERLIPIQRAYNAVKNRKHEFLNRISMGVLTVEDGSVDTDNLEDEGLSPGKILVYRQGSNPPRYMQSGNVPIDFQLEEDRLLEEFRNIGGVSDIFRNFNAAASQLSGVALQIVIEQDEMKISTTAENIRMAIKQVCGHVLRLYKQFAILPRIIKIVGDNGEIEMFHFKSSDISSDDVLFETESELGESLAQRRGMVFDLLKAGLLHDENGKLSNRMRIKALELLGFGIWENSQDVAELHLKKASCENVKLLSGQKVKVLEIDEHDLHIAEHTAFMLGSDFENKKEADETIVEKFLEHIREHKKYNLLTKSLEE